MEDIVYLKNKPLKPNTKNSNFLQFSDIWFQRKYKKGNFFYFETPKKSAIWKNYVRSVSEKYIRREYKVHNIEYPSSMVPIVLGYFGGLMHQVSKDAQEVLLIETLEVLKYIKT